MVGQGQASDDLFGQAFGDFFVPENGLDRAGLRVAPE
jgi:hypothetical protein